MVEVLKNRIKKSFFKAQQMVEKAEDVKIYSHIDCDGVCAGAILSSTLDKLEIDHEIDFIRLDQMEGLKAENELTIFSDLSSGQIVNKFHSSSSQVLVLDHHPPLRGLNQSNDGFLELNPYHYHINGSTHISGGGMAYLLAKTFGYTDLSWMGVLSAVGDMQNSLTGKLMGLNQGILKDGVTSNFVNAVEDLSFYGRQTRPLAVALSYFDDVNLPITNNRNECIKMLEKLEIKTKKGKKQRSLCDLSMDEKQKIFSELVKMLSREVPQRYVKHIPRLIYEDAYEFINEKKYSPLRDATEFSTAINACGRHNNHMVALEVLKGNRNSAIDKMEHLTYEHRRYLAQKMDWVREEDRIIQLKNLQYFEGDEIKSEVIGTITGMILSYGDWRKPIIGFTPIDNSLKVSLRCSRLLAYDGIHFGNIIRKVAEKVGGSGGGHSVACGAYISEERASKFLKLFDETLNGLV